MPAKSTRSGGNVGEADGTTPDTDAPGDGVTPEGSALADTLGLGRGLPLGVGDALTGMAVGGGGALGLGEGVGGGVEVSSSAAARRNVPLLSDEL